MADLTHIDNSGKVKMADISDKLETIRTAEAEGYILLNENIIEKIIKNEIEKGDVLASAKIAGISAAKRNWELIPLCHQIKITNIDLSFKIDSEKNKIKSISNIKGYDRTGVEMEALTAVAVSLLTIYDMCKAVSKDMVITDIRLLKKTGGKSDYHK
jgi:cyclic pyranopterin phosphate synthase